MLTEKQRQHGFSNNAIGSRVLGQSAIADMNGDGILDLILPNARQTALRIVTFAGGDFKQLAFHETEARMVSAIVPLTIVGLDAGTQVAGFVFGLEDASLMVLIY